MKKDRILNSQLIQAIASLGHTDLLVIGDAGLPIPPNVSCIDLSLVRGIPSFIDTLAAVCSELVIEACTLAEEMDAASPRLAAQTKDMLAGFPVAAVPHEALKTLSQKAKVIVRTGETTPFANVVLRCGVNF